MLSNSEEWKQMHLNQCNFCEYQYDCCHHDHKLMNRESLCSISPFKQIIINISWEPTLSASFLSLIPHLLFLYLSLILFYRYENWPNESYDN